jgi:hypothetical protein
MLIAVTAIALLVQPSQHAINWFRIRCFATAVNVPDGGTLMTGATVIRANATWGTWGGWLRQSVQPNRSVLPAQQERRFSPQILIQEQDEMILLRPSHADKRSGEPRADTR